MLTNQTRASLVQLIDAISPEAVRLLLIKHLDYDLWPISTHDLLEAISSAGPDHLAGLLVELIGGRTAIRTDAPTKYVFDVRDIGDVGEKLKCLCDQEKFCQSFTNVPKTRVELGRMVGCKSFAWSQRPN